MVLKTREKLIEVARQLFTNKGIENTTMNDIANASDKGRRTIYTYFKSKREIYNAVVEQENDQMVSQIIEISTLEITPTEKLERFLMLKFEKLNFAMTRQYSFRTLFNRDIKRVDRIRKLAFSKEMEVLKTILDEGVEKFEFESMQAKRLISLMPLILQGIDFSCLREGAPESYSHENATNKNVIKFIIEGIKL